MAIKIFLSCEKAKQPHIEKLIESLKSKNYEFVNESSIGSNNLEQNKKLINQCDWFMFIMTKTSVKQKSHCLRELAYAKTKCIGKILPIMWEKIEEPPMSLQRTQWVAFTSLDEIEEQQKKKEYYNSKISEIDAILSNKVSKDTRYTVFISYGHDKYAETLIKRIAKDLNENNQTSWIDFDYLHGSVDWEFKIQDGIDKSEYVIVFVTPHSMRQPDGYCLNEITYSNSKDKPILRINVELAQVPLSIINAPKLDFSECVDANGKIIEKKYKVNFDLLVNAIHDGFSKLQEELFENDKLIKCLAPVKNSNCIKSNSPFCGRKWLFEKYEQWLQNTNSKIWWIFAGAGIGKSAFITELSKKPNVKAVHYCVFNNEKDKRSNPKNVIMSLAYQLSTQIEPYRVALIEKINLNYEKLMEMKIDQLFTYLIVEPLKKINLDSVPIKNPDTNKFENKSIKPIVLVIDAIDEAAKEGELQTELLNFISNEFKATPEWLKLIITSRPETNVISRSGDDEIIYIEKDEHHLQDAKEYLEFALREFTEDFSKEEKNNKVNEILEKSEGNFEYISHVIYSLKLRPNEILNTDKYPKGLNAYYLKQFSSRLFRDTNLYDSKYRPLLEIILCSYESFNNEMISKILNTTSSDINIRGQYIEDFFPKKGDYIIAAHKSIADWLVNEAQAEYGISKNDGHTKLANYFYQKYKDNDIDEYCAKYLTRHCLECGKNKEAAEILKEGKVFTELLQYESVLNALIWYFNDLIAIYKRNKKLVLEVLNGKFFMDILTKYRTMFSNLMLYSKLNKIGFDEIALKIAYSECDLSLKSSLMNYYCEVNNFDEARKIIKSLGRKIDWKKYIIHFEIINTFSKFVIKKGKIGAALKFLYTIIRFYNNEKPENLEALYECCIAHILTGDALLYDLDFEKSEKAYKIAAALCIKINKTSKDASMKFSTNIMYVKSLSKLGMLYGWQLKYKKMDEIGKIIQKMAQDKMQMYIMHFDNTNKLFLNQLFVFKTLLPMCDEEFDIVRHLFKTSDDIALFEYFVALSYYIWKNKKAKDHIRIAYNHARDNQMVLLNDMIVSLNNKIDLKNKLSFDSKKTEEISKWVSYVDKIITKLLKKHNSN